MTYKYYDYTEFLKVFASAFGISRWQTAEEIEAELKNLHEKYSIKHDELFKVGDDSKTILHKIIYDKIRAGWPEFEEQYFNVIKNKIAPTYSESFLYQTHPTVRFHIPNNVCVGAFHKDSDFGHAIGEANHIIPLTTSYDTASVWVERTEGSGKFSPMNLITGTIITFNGNKLVHGSKINTTGKTRVSVDFRTLALNLYNEAEAKESVTQKTKFVLGGYYSLFKK